jgi:hypothetical protein
MVQLQQQDMQIKQQEQQRKMAKDQAENAFKAEQLKLDKARVIAEAMKANKQQQNDMLKTAAQLKADKTKNMINTGVDVLKHLSDQHSDHKHQSKDHAHQQDQRVLDALATQQQQQPTEGE